MTQVLLVAIGVAAAVFLLVFVGKLGGVMLEKDPHSVWGERLVMIGIAGRRSIRALAERYPVARAIAQSLPDSDPPPDDPGRTPVGPRRMPPPLPVLCLWLLGCADLTYARTVRDAAHDAAETAAPIVDLRCVAQQARDLAEVRALPERSPERERRAEKAQQLQRDRRCQDVVDAYDALRVASITLDATVAAAESGQCMSARGESCDVGGAAVRAAQATAAVAALVRQLEGAK